MKSYDILIRCKNEIKDLPKTVDTIKNQTIQPNQIIFVDSGSKDGSLEFAKKESFQIVNYKDKKFNYSKSLNLGMKHVKSSHVLILSAHCPMFSKDTVNIMFKTLTKFKAHGVYGRQIPTKKSNPIDIRDLLTVFGRERILYKKFPFFHNAFSLIKKSAWNMFNFDQNVNGIEDRLWATQVCGAGGIIIYEPEAIVYHQHGLNQTSNIKRATRVCKALSQLHREDIIEFPDTLSE